MSAKSIRGISDIIINTFDMSNVIRKLRNKVQISELSGAVIVVRIQGKSQKFVIGEDMKIPSFDKMLKMFNC